MNLSPLLSGQLSKAVMQMVTVMLKVLYIKNNKEIRKFLEIYSKAFCFLTYLRHGAGYF